MPRGVVAFVRLVDGFNRRVGTVTMYLIFVMMGILLYSSVSKALLLPASWTLESAQFAMAAYFMLGGAFAMQTGDHVRMDLFYSRWSLPRRSAVDAITAVALISYLVFMLYGGLSSTGYAIQYREKSFTAWAPYMWPIKVIMTFGVLLMLLQSIANLIKDIAQVRGKPIA